MPSDEKATPPDWAQSESEVTVKFALDSTVNKDKLKIKIGSSQLSVVIAGNRVFDSELSNKAVVDDSYWSIEGSGDARELVVTLCKKKAMTWRTLTKDQEEALPQKSELDEDFDVMQLEHDDDDPERVEEQEENERRLEARYKKLKTEKGLDHEDTLQTFFALFDNCIQLYRLNKLSDYLAEVVPACRTRTDKYKLKAVQALAFVRWKQSKFREALPLFHEMEEILGKGAALCENIAHTYNSLGDYPKAEEYFRQSLKFIEQEHGANAGNRGGVLLGLGLVRDRLGKHKEALPVCLKAYEFYKERAHGAPASLQAKAGISCAKLHAKLGNLPRAEEFIREAVQMYEITCGETSPLTASAYHELGKCLWKQRKRVDAQRALKRAYEIESMKDAWDLVSLLEIHNLLMDTHLKETDHIGRDSFQEYFGIVEYVTGRVETLPQDGNAAVYYKAAAELKAWGGRYEEAKALFNKALPLFELEQSADCSGLIQVCRDMLAFCDRNLAGTQNSPMSFDLPAQACSDSKTGATANDSTVQIEEIEEEDNHAGIQIEEVVDEPPETTEPSQQSVSPSSGMAPLCYRPLQASDFKGIACIAAACGQNLVVATERALDAHIVGTGADLCWVAERASNVQGFVIGSSDGIFVYLLQMLAVAKDKDEIITGLAENCAKSCRSMGLREMRATLSSSEDDGVLQRLGWDAKSVIYTRLTGHPQDSAQASGSSSTEATAASKLKRDGRDTGMYYNEWDQLNVEKALIEEDGGDASVVPERQRIPADEFSDMGPLEPPRKITKYSWDQSDKFVSVYVDFPGAGSLPDGSVDCIFRPRSFLLLVRSGDEKPKWLKVPNLCKDIDVQASTRKVKTDSVVVKLKKAVTALSWTDITDEKDEYQRRREFRVQHGDLKGATTEQLLADMYQNATDEERAGLRDAMKVNREKREEDAKQGK